MSKVKYTTQITNEQLLKYDESIICRHGLNTKKCEECERTKKDKKW